MPGPIMCSQRRWARPLSKWRIGDDRVLACVKYKARIIYLVSILVIEVGRSLDRSLHEKNL